MNNVNEFKRQISARIEAAFANYPVAVQASPEDDASFWVQVFCVPADQVEIVEDRIFTVQDELAPASEYMLLPMVKNLETTEQYYPEYLPQKPAAALASSCDDIFAAMPAQPEWSSGASAYNLPCKYYAVSRQLAILDAASDHGTLKAANRDLSDVSATTDLAFAA